MSLCIGRLPAAVLLLLVSWGVALGATSQPSTRAASSEPVAEGTPLRVVLFYSPTCLECEQEKNAVVRSEAKWGGRINAERHELKERDAFRELLAYEEHYGSKENDIPKLFIGGAYLSGRENVVGKLDSTISQQLEQKALTFRPGLETQDASYAVLDRLKGFDVGAVLVAGLVDGINPCAMTTVVFLLSMLAYMKKERWQIAVVGIGYTAAVFVTYFLLGVGVLGAVKVFAIHAGISRGLSISVAVLAFALATWSFVDFFRYSRTRDVSKVSLRLPEGLKNRIHKVIRDGLSTRSLAMGSITIGFLVAILESLCTGQVYLPTIVLVAQSPVLRSHAIGYLLLYNTAFILPLIGVLYVAYQGVASKRLGEYLTRHLGGLKLALAVLFGTLGVLVLMTV